MQYRDPHFQNPVVEGYTLLESTKPFIIIDPHGRKCYRPALAYVLGSPTVFNRDVQSMLESATITQLSSLLRRQHGIDIVRKGFSNLHNEYLSLLQNKVGMYLLISATPSGSMHYSVYDAFRGVLYYGTGIVVTIEDSDLASRASAKAVFESQGLLDIRAVGLFKRVSAKRYTPSSRSRRKKRKLQKNALQRKQDGGGEDAAVEDKEEATTACNKRNARKPSKRKKALQREQEGGSEARKKKKLEETSDEKCDEKPACENLAEPSCRLSMQLAGGMQPEAPPIVEIHDNGITSEHRSSSQTSWNINIVRPKVRCGSLSLQGATRARKVARAMKDAERARQEAEPQTVEEETKSFTRGEDSGPAAEFKAQEVQEAHELRVATEQTEHAHAPEPEPFCPTRCMSPDNDNVTYDPHLLDTVLTKHGLQAALNVLQESDRAWFVNRLFKEGQPLYSQHEEEDAWMRRLSGLCTELRLQMPQLRNMGLDIHLMRAMLESDGM